ncbi:MAG TPA: hypothetical protein VFC07_14995 [Verrucomicrobiae bacterium]|nr:hypothetical protein [Verrucomicrobiae bacterium]
MTFLPATQRQIVLDLDPPRHSTKAVSLATILLFMPFDLGTHTQETAPSHEAPFSARLTGRGRIQ